MGIRIHDGVSVRDISQVRVHDGTAVRTIQRISIHDGTAVRTVFVAFTANLSPTTAFGSYNGTSGLPQNITTGLVLATPVGGTSPYTYAWQLVGSSPYTWVFTAGTSATTALTAQAIEPGVATSISFRCLVTDNNGNQAYTPTGLATVTNNSV